ncbi:glycine zipper 2TM domain-containing protein [Immundisolibacter sp.]|uniref:glycine zipper 2TM domain-containing protein n=1 Tax=Immundisolibacter sp. TaxID=1934948 RepID=UPI002634355C|nr:glycine zipper 2TM domain-containing protein [Immundisolibacter sp.]MDD3651305.1 glycine zipper 2TM domain-containing protein [Immundisolibacter sp.]
MATTRIAQTVCIALLLSLGACRDKTNVADGQTTEPPAATQAQQAEKPPAEPTGGVPTSRAAAPSQPLPAPVCADCGTVTNVRSYQVKGQASGVGAAVGAVAGGLLGHQIGGGTGKKIATVAGAVGGGLAGHEIEKRRRSETQWEVTVQMDDGRTITLPYAQAPAVSVGQKVRVVGGAAVPR